MDNDDNNKNEASAETSVEASISNTNLTISLTSPIGDASFFNSEEIEDDSFTVNPNTDAAASKTDKAPAQAHGSGNESDNETERAAQRHDRISSQRPTEKEAAEQRPDVQQESTSKEAVGDTGKSDEAKKEPSVTSGTSSSSTTAESSPAPAPVKAPTPEPVTSVADKSEMSVFFEEARYFMIKSANYENVSLARARGVWATLPGNERKLNIAFRNSQNVLLIFSVKESGRFQGIARLAAPSNRSYPTVHWVLPYGMTSDALSGTFELDWLTRRELSFNETSRIYNKLNEGKPVKIGRDGQEIDPEAGLALCRLFPFDDTLHLEDALRHHRDWRRRQQIRPDEGGEGEQRPPPFASKRYERGGGRYHGYDRRGGYRGEGRFGRRSEDLRSTFEHPHSRERTRQDADRRRYRSEGRSRHHDRSRRHSRSRSRSRSRYEDDRHRRSGRNADYHSSSSSEATGDGQSQVALSALLADAAVAAEAIRANTLLQTNPLAAVLANASLTTPTGLPPLNLLQQLFPMAPPPLPTLPLVPGALGESSQGGGDEGSRGGESDEEISQEQHNTELDQFLSRMSRGNAVGR